MDRTEKDAIKGRLLDLWVEDLRSDRRPRIAPEMEQLTNEEIEEVMELARFHKAALAPTRLEQDTLDGLASTVLSRLMDRRAEEGRMAEEVAAGAGGFNATLQAARERRGIGEQVLERTLGVPNGLIALLESGELPPHRFAIERMVRLLQSLRLNSERIIDLIRQASLAWAQNTFTRPQMRLGRVDASASEQEHRESLAGSVGDTDADEFTEEVARIETYCQTLTAKLPRGATAGQAG